MVTSPPLSTPAPFTSLYLFFPPRIPLRKREQRAGRNKKDQGIAMARPVLFLSAVKASHKKCMPISPAISTACDLHNGDYFHLTTSDNTITTVKIERIDNHLYASTGWRDFLRRFGLQIGDHIMFRAICRSSANIVFFDKDGNQIHPHLLKDKQVRPICSGKHVTLKRKTADVHEFAPKKKSVIVINDENDKAHHNTAKQALPLYVTNKTKHTQHSYKQLDMFANCTTKKGITSNIDMASNSKQPHRKLKGSQALPARELYCCARGATIPTHVEEYIAHISTVLDETEKFYVMSINATAIKQGRVYFTTQFSTEFLTKHIGDEPTEIRVKAAGGERGTVLLSTSTDGRCNLTVGWKSFMKDSSISIGAICIFHFYIRKSLEAVVYIVSEE